MSLPANSTFLPIIDDLLSPDFRPSLLPILTPTPTNDENRIPTLSFNVSGSEDDNLSQKSLSQKPLNRTFEVIKEEEQKGRSDLAGKENNESGTPEEDKPAAAAKIQNWWKKNKVNSKVVETGNVDIVAERVKHSIRHTRTEDHIRLLEDEVTRLKSALNAERRLRSLQVEAIRSLWNQVQKLSTSPGGGHETQMTQSMPNGIPEEVTNQNVMSQSLNSAALRDPNCGKNRQQSTLSSSCSCSQEIQVLRTSLAGEMSQLRGMIDALKKDSPPSCSTASSILARDEEGSVASEGGDSEKSKRPFSLNLPGQGLTTEVSEGGKEGGVEVVGDYANEMANKLLDNVHVEKGKYFPD